MRTVSKQFTLVSAFCPIQDRHLKALVIKSLEGSNVAFEEIYRQSIHALFVSVHRMCGHHTEDILADTYFQAWETLDTFEADRCSVLGWLVTIARSRARDRARRERVRHGGLDGAIAFDPDNEACEGLGPEEQADAAKQCRRLGFALANLTPTQRWVLSLAYYRDHSHQEIAALTGMPLGTVKTLILRSHKQLRGMMTLEAPSSPSGHHVVATAT